MTRRRYATISVIVVLAIAAAGVGVYNHWKSAADVRKACTATRALARERSGQVSTGTRRVDVLGDSYALGSGVPAADAWPVLLGRAEGWTVTVRAVGGTGFLNGGRCGAQQYEHRIAQMLADRPSLVIVEGGLNDADDPGALHTAAARLLHDLRGTTVAVVGPARAPARAAAAEADVDRTLAAVVGGTRLPYVSALDWQLTFLSDGVHPDVAGQHQYATRLAAALAAAK